MPLTWKNVNAPTGGSGSTVGNIAAIKGITNALDRANIFKTLEKGASDRYDTARTEEQDLFKRESDLLNREKTQLGIDDLTQQAAQEEANKAIFGMAQQYRAENPNVSEREALDTFSKLTAGMGGDAGGYQAGREAISAGYGLTGKESAIAEQKKVIGDAARKQADAMALQKQKDEAAFKRVTEQNKRYKGKDGGSKKGISGALSRLSANPNVSESASLSPNSDPEVIDTWDKHMYYGLTKGVPEDILSGFSLEFQDAGGTLDVVGLDDAINNYLVNVPTSNKAVAAKLKKGFQQSQQSTAPTLLDAYRR